MGSFEKLVVLTVIFLASVVLVVSFQTPAEETSPRGGFVARADDTGASELGATERRSSAEDLAPAAGATAPGNPFSAGERTPAVQGPGEASRPGGLLSASGQDRGADPAAGRAAATEAAAPAPSQEPVASGYPTLRDGVAGLTAHPGGLHVYRVGATDRSWNELSQRFYGSGAWADLLRRENAAVGPPVPGQEILVPSSSMPAASIARSAAFEPRVPGRAAPRDPKETAAGADDAASLKGETFRTYVVQEDDTLSGIAFEIYGRASLWRRIFDANRDLLPDENDLKIGMELRIP